MPEIGPMMRALELQRLIEDKVAEWRERSARVAGASVADSYQQPLNFKRHTHRRKNHAEINKIIAKYSKPTKRTDGPYLLSRDTPQYIPQPPPRTKKVLSNLKVLSKSEDNLAAVGTMEVHPEPKKEAKTYFTVSKYNTKSCEDVTAFVDVHGVKSKNFEENSILNAKPVVERRKHKLHSISEGITNSSEHSDSGMDSVMIDKSFVTSTPLSKRKSTPANVSGFVFEKVSKKPNSASELRKGSSEPNILSAKEISENPVNTKTLDFRKRWKMLKPPFKKGAFDCLLLWRAKKPNPSPVKKPR